MEISVIFHKLDYKNLVLVGVFFAMFAPTLLKYRCLRVGSSAPKVMQFWRIQHKYNNILEKSEQNS